MADGAEGPRVMEFGAGVSGADLGVRLLKLGADELCGMVLEVGTDGMRGMAELGVEALGIVEFIVIDVGIDGLGILEVEALGMVEFLVIDVGIEGLGILEACGAEPCVVVLGAELILGPEMLLGGELAVFDPS
jgi:hypothetical protein